MEEEVEDCIGDVKYTDSQNTISTSLIYQVSVNGSNSDDHHSSGKETYIIECDSDDSTTTYEVNFSKTVLYANPNCFKPLKHGINNSNATMDAALAQNQDCSIVAQETYTQTSKTIIQLAKADQGMMETNSLQTQTSKLLITEKQSREVKIEVHCPSASVASDFLGNFKFHRNETIMPCAKINEYDPIAHKHAIEEILNIVDDFNDSSRDNSFTNNHSHSGCQLSDREMDDDSLCDELKDLPHVDTVSDSETPKSARNDVEELYKKISEIDIFGVKRTDTNYIKPFTALTPLTEESVIKESANNSFGNNKNNMQNKLILKDKSISDSILYRELSCTNLISNLEDFKDMKIDEINCLCDAQSCMFDSPMCIVTEDTSKGQIQKNYTRSNYDKEISPPITSAMTTFPNTEPNSAITSRSALTGFTTSEKLGDINEECGFARHEKVLSQISSLFNKNRKDEQQKSSNENTPHSKKSVTIAVGENQANVKPKTNDNEDNASQTIPMKSLDQNTQCDNEMKPVFFNYEPSESSGIDSNAHTIDADGIDINIKLLPDSRKRQNKLPQIEGKTNDKPTSCPNSSRLNVLLTVNASAKRPASKPEVLPHIRKSKVNSKDSITASSKMNKECDIAEPIRLPPIKDRKTIKSAVTKHRCIKKLHKPSQSEVFQDMISVDGMIRELRTTSRPKSSARSNRKSRSLSRGQSPAASTTASEKGPSLERACDNMLTDIMRRLRSLNWLEVVDTLNDIPRQMSKFWCAAPESRVADLIRLVTALTDSPRTQVARSACTALAEILKKTNYTKKPEFFEAMSSLLAKSGSYNRCVRRAANLALDDVISSIETTKAVTALTVHGADHKSPLVRSATARLLVVCCALGGGGGDLLKSKPPSLATARRLLLSALSLLIEDKNIETRKFAERLYIMLRQQPNFEAFYLTDVDVEIASRQLKKYDQLLFESGEETPKKIR